MLVVEECTCGMTCLALFLLMVLVVWAGYHAYTRLFRMVKQCPRPRPTPVPFMRDEPPLY